MRLPSTLGIDGRPRRFCRWPYLLRGPLLCLSTGTVEPHSPDRFGRHGAAPSEAAKQRSLVRSKASATTKRKVVVKGLATAAAPASAPASQRKTAPAGQPKSSSAAGRPKTGGGSASSSSQRATSCALCGALLGSKAWASTGKFGPQQSEFPIGDRCAPCVELQERGWPDMSFDEFVGYAKDGDGEAQYEQALLNIAGPQENLPFLPERVVGEMASVIQIRKSALLVGAGSECQNLLGRRPTSRMPRVPSSSRPTTRLPLARRRLELVRWALRPPPPALLATPACGFERGDVDTEGASQCADSRGPCRKVGPRGRHSAATVDATLRRRHSLCRLRDR